MYSTWIIKSKNRKDLHSKKKNKFQGDMLDVLNFLLQISKNSVLLTQFLLNTNIKAQFY